MGAAWLQERFTTRGSAPDRNTAAGHLGAGVGLIRDLPAGFYLMGDVVAQTYFFRQADPDRVAVFAVRTGFSAGKRF